MQNCLPAARRRRLRRRRHLDAAAASIFPQRHSRRVTRCSTATSVVIKTHAHRRRPQQLFMHGMIEKIFGRRTKLMFDPGLFPPRTNVIRFSLRLGMIQIPLISPTTTADSVVMQTT